MRNLLVCVVALPLYSCSQTAIGAPPKVIKAVPDNGAVAVDANLKEIRITFDQPMDKGMSVVGGGETYPEVLGKPKWMNDRTITLRVKLQPNHDYWLSINSNRFQNFTNHNGEPAAPYPIQFRTGAASLGDGSSTTDAAAAPETVDPKTNRRAFNLLRSAVRDEYSYRDRLSIDWESLFKSVEASLIAAKTPTEFAHLAATALARAKDKHIWLQVGDETIPTYVNPSVVNANYALLPKLVPNLKKQAPALLTGRWNDGVGYIAIAAWDKKKLGEGNELLEALKSLGDTRALIIDVRANGGGAEPLAQEFAGYFISEPRLYAKNVYRDGKSPSGFTAPKERWVQPNKDYPKYGGKVAVLSGPPVMSSCESFLLMMKQVPGTVIVGVRSQGSSGNPKPNDLGNGVTVFLPSWKDLTADGQELEGIGIPPDIEVTALANDFQNADPVLQAALQHLRGASNK